MINRTNGRPPADISAAEDRMLDVVHNVLMRRVELFGKTLDPRRDIDDECGFPKALTPQHYQDMYDRSPVANRVVQFFPRQCFQVQPEISEVLNGDRSTQFERDYDELGASLQTERTWFKRQEGSPLNDLYMRADIVSGISCYGAVVLGYADGLDPNVPVAGFEEQNSLPGLLGETATGSVPTYGFTRNAKVKNKLLFARAFSELNCQAIAYETNWTSPRFGRPTRYRVSYSTPYSSTDAAKAPSASMTYHWSRVVHIVDNDGVPRMQPVFNNLYGIRQILSAGPEAFWKNCMLTLSLESNPQLGDAMLMNKDDLRDMMERYGNGLQKWIALIGMQAKSIAPNVVDPTPHLMAQIKAICIMLDVPERVFVGGERGNITGGVEEDHHTDNIRARENNHCTPNVIAPIVDRLIATGVLSEPKEVHCTWPPLAEQSATQKADLLTKRVAAYTSYTQGMNSMIGEKDFMTKFDSMSDEEADAILENAPEERTQLPEQYDPNLGY